MVFKLTTFAQQQHRVRLNAVTLNNAFKLHNILTSINGADTDNNVAWFWFSPIEIPAIVAELETDKFMPLIKKPAPRVTGHIRHP